jgi:hypothetical protein
MSAPTSEASALPVTGSGPFTLAIGLIGVVAIAVGAMMRRIAKRDDSPSVPLPPPTMLPGPHVSTDLSGAAS